MGARDRWSPIATRRPLEDHYPTYANPGPRPSPWISLEFREIV